MGYYRAASEGLQRRVYSASSASSGLVSGCLVQLSALPLREGYRPPGLPKSSSAAGRWRHFS
eukprot:8096461-Alexandrium_andersonii.AAC.1